MFWAWVYSVPPICLPTRKSIICHEKQLLMSLRTSLMVALVIRLSSVHAAAPYCLAGDSCFPSDDLLAQFEQSLQGNLIKSLPYGSACYSATYDAEQCIKIANESRTFDFRESQAGKMLSAERGT
jgi:hypothetical protein